MRVRVAPASGATSPPVAGTIRASMSLTVLDKRADGSTLLELVTRKIADQPAATDEAAVGGRVKLRIAPDGRILDVSGTGGVFSLAGVDPGALVGGTPGGSTDSLGSHVLFPRFPDGEIRPGDLWSRSSKISIPFTDTKADIRTASRFERFESTRRGRAARLGLNVTTPLDYSVSVDDVTRAVRESASSEEPVPSAPPGARLRVDGRTVTNARALVLSRTSELLSLTGTTTVSVRLDLQGVSKEDLNGAPTSYSFDSTIEMSIVRQGK